MNNQESKSVWLITYIDSEGRVKNVSIEAYEIAAALIVCHLDGLLTDGYRNVIGVKLDG